MEDGLRTFNRIKEARAGLAPWRPDTVYKSRYLVIRQ